MTSRERILLCLDHKEPDMIPLDLATTNSTGIAVRAYDNLLSYLKIDKEIKTANVMQQLAEVDEQVLELFGVDTRGIAPNSAYPTDIQSNSDNEQSFYDEWGTGWKKPKDGFYFDMFYNPLKNAQTVKDIEKFQWPDLKLDIRLKGLREKAESIRSKGKAVFLKGFVPGVFEFASWLRGYDQFLMDLYINKGIAEALLEKALHIKTTYWTKALTKMNGLVDIVNESDDLGTQNGPLIAPEIYREVIKPRHKKITAIIKKYSNAKIFLHSCGSVFEFIPDIIDVGFDILNPVQLSAKGMDPILLKKEFGKEITFWGGGIDTQWALPKASQKEIKDQVKRNIDYFSKDGGFVFSQVHNIQADVPPENILAMYEAFNENRSY